MRTNFYVGQPSAHSYGDRMTQPRAAGVCIAPPSPNRFRALTSSASFRKNRAARTPLRSMRLRGLRSRRTACFPKAWRFPRHATRAKIVARDGRYRFALSDQTVSKTAGKQLRSCIRLLAAGASDEPKATRVAPPRDEFSPCSTASAIHDTFPSRCSRIGHAP